MIDFLQSIRSDLLSRRLLPLLALLGLALLAAVGYAFTSGSGGATSPPPASVSNSTAARGATPLPVTAAPADPNEAVSETPGGVRYQSQGPTRDPFIPLSVPPAAKKASASSSSSSSSSSAKSTGSSSVGTGSSSTGASSGGQQAPVPTAPIPPKKASKPRFPYAVSVLFGPASTTPGQSATLTPYGSLKLLQPLPSKQDARIVFERVTSNGKGAVFKLLVPPILHGTGVCLPSTSECEAIDLKAGQAEELEYVEANGRSVLDELKVVSIAKQSAGANAARAGRGARAARAKRK
jgi:hypothetical protein